MKEQKKFLTLTLSALLLLLAIFLFSYVSYAKDYKDERLIPNTYLGQTNISGLNQNEVKEILKEKEAEIRKEGLEFSYNNKLEVFPLSLQLSSPDIPDSNLQYADSFIFEIEKTNSEIFSKKNNSFIKYLLAKIQGQKNENYLFFSYQTDILDAWLKENFPQADIEPENAYFSVIEEKGELKLINNTEKIGKEIDKNELNKEIIKKIASANFSTINISTKSKYPQINQAQLETLRSEAEELLSRESFEIYYLDQAGNKEEKIVFEVDKKEFITWIGASESKEGIKLDYDRNKIAAYLNEDITRQVQQEVVLPRFDIEESGKVSSWQAGKNGRELDLDMSTENIVLALESKASEAQILSREISVDSYNNENDFKIKEIIGTGHSNFAGSPANRRHNIRVGAEAVHGMLIKPGGEFSLVETLGDIDASTGYLPELVIKGNETIPEYGGGLCQIATTLFRSALESGLPITARRSHSYRVSYYEPAGTDASIYDPWPDVKFVNDTGSYVLIQSRIEDNDIYFDFWGTEDGRVATTTEPVIYNITAPPPTKIIETDELAPGEKKCTERAHNGADAYFDYIVTYPESSTTTPVKEVRFSSHYVPWQEVCLVGKAEDKTEEGQSATSTEEIENTETKQE